MPPVNRDRSKNSINKLDSVNLYLGDCSYVLPNIEKNSIDSLVTDPPAGIKFMSKDWDDSKGGLIDWIDWFSRIMEKCLLVLKAGSFGLVWALPRTSHWTGTALELAGFEIRDRISHLFGQGFPKAKSCLKPACEDWWLVRKPGEIRPLQIDECRIAGVVPQVTQGVTRRAPQESNPHPAGRWPANVVLSHHPDCVCVGTKRVKSGTAHGQNASAGSIYGNGKGLVSQAKGEETRGYADAEGMEMVEEWCCHEDCPIRLLDEQSGIKTTGHDGMVSRFFYCTKASRSDRGENNNHPTVKSIKLMEWLVKLVTPPYGLCLDPFMGSGSTGVACINTGRKFIGIESKSDYFAISKRRINEAQRK